MCLRPSAPESIQPERRAAPPPFIGQQWIWEEEGQQHLRRLNLNRHRNDMDHLLKIKFNCSNDPPCSLIERKMFGIFSSAFECSFLFAATVSALFSIVQPKLKDGLLVMAVPICALIPSVTGISLSNNEEQQAGEQGIESD